MKLRPTATTVLLALGGAIVLPGAASAAIPGATIAALGGTGVVCAIPTTACGDGAAATAAQLSGPRDIAVTPAGAILVADTGANRIRRIALDGTISTVAGSGSPCSVPTGTCGDGAQAALTAQLNIPQGIAVIDEDSFLIADSNNHKIRRVDGTDISTIAGTGTSGFNGDGLAGTATQLSSPRDVGARGDGSVLVVDRFNDRIRRLAGGVVTTVAGSGTTCSDSTDPCGDGGAAAQARLGGPQGLSLLPGTGFLFVEPITSHVRRVSADVGGTITRAAGTTSGSTGDGGPATAAQVNSPDDVTVLPDGGFVIADSSNHRVRIVTSTGVIDTLAGTGTPCPDPTQPCGDGGPAEGSQVSTPRGVGTAPDGDVVVGDTDDNRVREIDLPLVITPSTPPPSQSQPQPQQPLPQTPAQTTVAPPQVGRSALVVTVSGTVFVRPPGSSTVVRPGDLTNIPDGSRIDTRTGTARITVALPDGSTQAAVLSGGIVRIDQRTDGSLVDLRLAEAQIGCPRPVRDPGSAGAQTGVRTAPRPKRAATASSILGSALTPLVFAPRAVASARKRRTRKVRVRADGRFRTDGRYGSAVVRGTDWTTVDDCREGAAQTRVSVRSGRVGVRDFARARTTVVPKGRSYVARARRT